MPEKLLCRCGYTSISKWAFYIVFSDCYTHSKSGDNNVIFDNESWGMSMNQNLYPHLFQPLTEVTESDWQKVINTNLTGVFHCMKYELLQMQKQGRGAIVNNASIGGLRMAPGFGAYGPSKAGVIAITQTAALENADKGIRVNVICPGPTPTPLNTPEKVAEFSTWFAERCAQHMDMSLPESSVEDQANAILFFAEDASAAVTGQYLIVDHGTTI
jgi:NAD(P)-dependent dehydrogenase (short-subunit alcohol dehydrogenase family)